MNDDESSDASNYPILPEDESEWRPHTATDILLRDRDLAKLGFLAQAEAIAKLNVITAIKGLDRLDTLEWRALERQQFSQLVKRMCDKARLADDKLSSLSEKVRETYEDALSFRHKNLHASWAWNSARKTMMAWDLSRNEQITTDDLSLALSKVADLTFSTKACLFRVGRLLQKGRLAVAEGSGGPHICVSNGQWIKI